jgi:hypothetical protein
MQQVVRWRLTVHDYHYRHTEHKHRGETLQPTALPSLTPTVTEILG